MTTRPRTFPLLAMSVFSACWGLFAFFGVAGNPRFESIHVLDVIRLMTAGAGFAVAIFTLALFFVRRSEEKRAGEKSGEASN